MPRAPYIAAMFIETETTPNPATLKFLPGQRVMPSGTRDFASPEEAEASPLAQALFDTGEVTGVFFGGDFVSVTAAPGVDWGLLKPQVVAVLLDHFVSQAPLFAGGDASGILVPGEDDDDVGDDPWDAQTLEWTTTSPAPSDNFVDVPLVHSAEPLLDLKASINTAANSASRDGSPA